MNGMYGNLSTQLRAEENIEGLDGDILVRAVHVVSNGSKWQHNSNNGRK
jgi:hypothetical protein